LAARSVGIPWEKIRAGLKAAGGVPGRLEKILLPNGALALVDYAHTDDALGRVIETLRELPHRRLIVVFGCGGDRDRSKRPRMARAAAAADRVIVTSDNPRNEDPAAIIADIVAGFPAGCASEIIPERRAALARGLELSGPGDLLLVAGKGHENYQEIAGRRHPFDDRLELRRLSGLGLAASSVV
jgi:UDP-N-acetylmuramoyl-L-alanyl-D-glutamate--2,6-diaminopimelate ligase